MTGNRRLLGSSSALPSRFRSEARSLEIGSFEWRIMSSLFSCELSHGQAAVMALW